MNRLLADVRVRLSRPPCDLARIALEFLRSPATRRRSARAGRLLIVVAIQLLMGYVLLIGLRVRVPGQADVQALVGVLLDEPRRGLIGWNPGTLKPKLEEVRLELRQSLLRVRLPNPSVIVAPLRVPPVPFRSPLVAAAKGPAEGARTVTAARAPRDREGGRQVGGSGRDHGIIVLSRFDPPYPPAAYLAGEGGTAVVAVRVDRYGRPSQLKVIRGSGFALLDRAAARAVRQWKFEAATKGGRPVGAWGEVQVNFHLQWAGISRVRLALDLDVPNVNFAVQWVPTPGGRLVVRCLAEALTAGRSLCPAYEGPGKQMLSDRIVLARYQMPAIAKQLASWGAVQRIRFDSRGEKNSPFLQGDTGPDIYEVDQERGISWWFATLDGRGDDDKGIPASLAALQIFMKPGVPRASVRGASVSSGK